ncbi:MAG: D-alanyl-D-alanine carboxypeptidase [Muribaculaceae bacterium]|nr:D-alanyl-D-alanine carboxypeptidase [Muribaculaceae bacterium]MDE6753407.1 D-alanyl-D-alanine carboxypeptidase [Muribaculaceae bacterium]
MIKNLKLIVLLAACFVLQAYASDPQAAVDEFVRKSGVRAESLAVKVTDLASGKSLASHNSASPLVPASIMKSVTSAALLEEAGPDFRFHTRVYIDGILDMGILRGNVVVEGSGDPSLYSSVEPYGTDLFKEIAETLHDMGIIQIEGKIIVDESAYPGPSRPASWMKADFSTTYGTGFHALNYRNNTSGNKAVENPSALFIRHLSSSLASSGIPVENKEVGIGRRTLILDHLSPPLDEIMRSCMMRSDNLFAESMLRMFGRLRGGSGSAADAASKAMEHWRKSDLPIEGVVIVDGSGLSRSNRVTADFMTAMLKSMSDDATYASCFPLAGQEGTLRRFLVNTPLDSYVAMKTGSMKGIQCYAGYKLDDDYVPTHTIVIIMNDINGSRDVAKKAAERMLLEIFSEE